MQLFSPAETKISCNTPSPTATGPLMVKHGYRKMHDIPWIPNGYSTNLHVPLFIFGLSGTHSLLLCSRINIWLSSVSYCFDLWSNHCCRPDLTLLKRTVKAHTTGLVC